MLTNVKIKRYKSLYDVDVDLEPLTVFIGPNGSGKSSVCEALELVNKIYKTDLNNANLNLNIQTITSFIKLLRVGSPQSAFWKGNASSPLEFEFKGLLRKVKVYNFVPTAIMKNSNNDMLFSGEGVTNSLTKILFDDRDRFIELEQRFIKLVPNIARIKLNQASNKTNILSLVDKSSDYAIPSANVSDGTLRLLAFLVALYDVEKPNIICFEEPENGVHPWLLNKIMELLKTVSTEGLNGTPAQVLITTHSPTLLNYVEPKQIRAVELNKEGATQIHALPTDSKRFQAAMEAYDHELGELWFTDAFGGNPV